MLCGLAELRKIGVFTSALIKKRRYWTKYVPGNMMDNHMYAKEAVSVDTLHGSMVLSVPGHMNSPNLG